MRVFLDFEASSLAKKSYPIEVGWVFENGTEEAYLIRPAVEWTEWDNAVEAIHYIPRESLLRDGVAVETVAARMVTALSGHDLFASAPSWDGKWLSALLRAGGQPRHALRLRDSEEAWIETACAILGDVLPAADLAAAAADLVALATMRVREGPPAHRALADARGERDRWLAVRDAARAAVSKGTAGTV